MVSCDNFCSCEVKLREKYALPPLFAVAPEVRTWRDKLGLVKYLPFLVTSGKWGKVTNFQFAERLRNPFLRAAFHALFQGREMGIRALAPQLAWFDQKCVAFPSGGSRQFAQRIAKRYESLGVGRTFEREPWLFRFPLADPLVLPDGTRHERMNTHIYNHPSAPSSFTLNFCLLWRIFRLTVAMNWAIGWVRPVSWDGSPSASHCGRKEAKHRKIGLIM